MGEDKRSDCFGKNRGGIIVDVMRSPWIRGLCCALSVATIGLLAQASSAADRAKDTPVAKKDQAPPAFTLAKKDEKVVINGRAWNLSELRPAWALDPKWARHTPNRSSRTHAPRSRVVQGSSQHRSH